MEVQAGGKRQSKFTAQQFKEYLQYSDKSLGNLFYQSHNETKTCSYLLQAGAELWAGLDGPGPAHIDSWPAQSEIKKIKYYSVLLNMDTTLCGVFHL